jgi:16S rRNA processing protein RimM
MPSSFQDKDQAPRRVCLGRIAEAHGIKGLVKVLFYGDDVESLEKYGALYTSETGMDTMTIKLKNPQGKYYLAEIEGVTDRNQSEALRGTEFWLDRDKLPKPKKGEYYIADLIGLDAFKSDGKKIGRVTAIDNFGAGNLIEVQPENGAAYYIPFNKDTIVKIDTGSGIVLNPPYDL